MIPSHIYRQNIRFALRAFSSLDDEARLFVTPINRMLMDDLEAAFELVMGFDPLHVAPSEYRTVRPYP
jgi:hypothetical protein